MDEAAANITFTPEFIRTAMALLDPAFTLSEEAESLVATIMRERAVALLQQAEDQDVPLPASRQEF
jgi:hypothetical protein